MSVGIKNNSVFAIKLQSGDDIALPASGADFLPLVAGNTLTQSNETIENDELTGDIGSAKKARGKESVEGKHNANLRHSGIEGQAPQIGLMFESLMGLKTVNATEYPTLASSTTKILKVTDGTNFYEGQGLLIKDNANGWSIRNVKKITGNDLELNFALSNAPAAGVSLGKCVSYKPAGSNHPVFSSWFYEGNGHAIQAGEKCTVTECSLEFSPNEYAKANFSYAGTKYYFNPITLTSSTRYIDFTSDNGTFAAVLTAQTYNGAHELADAIADAMNAADPLETFTCTYSDVTGMFTIESSTSAILELLFTSGANTANSIDSKIGFTDADKTGATTYTSDSELSYASPYTPSFDLSDPIIIKGAELFIGNQDKNICQCATTLTISIAKEMEDVDCICEENGTKEKIPTGRTVSMEAELVLSKHDVSLFKNILNNDTISAMFNAGPKSSGKWNAGKSFNFYMQNASVTNLSVEGDSFIVAKVTLEGFVDSDGKDGFINFL